MLRPPRTSGHCSVKRIIWIRDRLSNAWPCPQNSVRMRLESLHPRPKTSTGLENADRLLGWRDPGRCPRSLSPVPRDPEQPKVMPSRPPCAHCRYSVQRLQRVAATKGLPGDPFQSCFLFCFLWIRASRAVQWPELRVVVSTWKFKAGNAMAGRTMNKETFSGAHSRLDSRLQRRAPRSRLWGERCCNLLWAACSAQWWPSPQTHSRGKIGDRAVGRSSSC